MLTEASVPLVNTDDAAAADKNKRPRDLHEVRGHKARGASPGIIMLPRHHVQSTSTSVISLNEAMQDIGSLRKSRAADSVVSPDP